MLLPLLLLQVSSREVELEGLKSNLTRLLSGLDAHREAEQQVLAGHTTRLSKEAARLEALQVSQCSEAIQRANWALHRPWKGTTPDLSWVVSPEPSCAHVGGGPLLLQAALLSEREEAKLALVTEKQALEEARSARIKVRSLA